MKQLFSGGNRVIVPLLGALAVAGGCSTKASEGTNTNWACSANEDCADAGENATCVAHQCLVATTDAGSGGKRGSGGSPGSGGKREVGGQGGGVTNGGGGADSGIPDGCTRATRPEPCSSRDFECLDFRKEAYKYSQCYLYLMPRAQPCGEYTGLIFDGIGDFPITEYYFRKSDGRLAGTRHNDAFAQVHECTVYDDGFTFPECPPSGLKEGCEAPGRPLEGRAYDAVRGCYAKKAVIEDPAVSELTLRETEPSTSGTHEMACFIASDGTRYAIWKGYTECVGPSTDSATPANWRVFGGSGLCEEDIALDPECQRVIDRGLFDTGGGLGTGELVTVDAGDHAGECP